MACLLEGHNCVLFWISYHFNFIGWFLISLFKFVYPLFSFVCSGYFFFLRVVGKNVISKNHIPTSKIALSSQFWFFKERSFFSWPNLRVIIFSVLILQWRSFFSQTSPLTIYFCNNFFYVKSKIKVVLFYFYSKYLFSKYFFSIFIVRYKFLCSS